MVIGEDVEIVLLILLGLPASGKTSFSKLLIDLISNVKVSGEIGKRNHRIIHICYDALVPQISQQGAKWSENRKEVVMLVENIIRLAKSQDCSELENYLRRFEIQSRSKQNEQIVSETTILVIDDNMYYRSMRYEYFKLAKMFEISFAEICIHCSVDKVCKRNSQRSEDRVPDEIIVRMAEKLCCPSDKNAWEKFFCCISNELSFDECDVHAAFEVLEKSLKEPFTAISVDSDTTVYRKCVPSLIHEADIALRRVIGNKIKQHSYNIKDDKDFQKSLSLKKQMLLQELKDGVLEVPESVYKLFEVRSDELQKELQQWCQSLM